MNSFCFLLLPLFVILKVGSSCTDGCNFNNYHSNIPGKGIGIDWGVFFSQIQVKDFPFFGLLGIEHDYYFSNNTHLKEFTTMRPVRSGKAVSSWRKCWSLNKELARSLPRVK